MDRKESQPELPGVTGENISLMSEDDLRAFVDDLVSGHIFTSAHLNSQPDLVPMVFLPIALGALSKWSATGLNNLGVVWERMDKAGPTSINGYPTFFSMHLMHREDWVIAAAAANREHERRKAIEL